jgi:hypothetical protein
VHERWLSVRISTYSYMHRPSHRPRVSLDLADHTHVPIGSPIYVDQLHVWIRPALPTEMVCRMP